MTFTAFSMGLGAALGMGLLIGLERELGQHPAGLRTNALVAAGAALYVLLGQVFNNGTDTARVAAQIVSGVGFLGGGVILREGLTVRGLTTAATLWCSAAVGALCGADMVRHAGIATAAVLATNFALNPISRWIDHNVVRFSYIDASYRLKVVCEMSEERRIRHIIAQEVTSQRDLVLRGIGIQNADQPDRGMIVADLDMRVRDQHILQDIVALLNADPATSSVSWGRQS